LVTRLGHSSTSKKQNAKFSMEESIVSETEKSAKVKIQG